MNFYLSYISKYILTDEISYNFDLFEKSSISKSQLVLTNMNYLKNEIKIDYIYDYPLFFSNLTELKMSFKISVLFLLVFGLILFLVGINGILFYGSNFFLFLLYCELSLSGLIFNFIILEKIYSIQYGQLYSLIIIVLAACESVIGLALLLLLQRSFNSINLKFLNLLRF